MPDDALRQAKTLTAAGAAAAGIVAILFFTPILDMGFCFPHTCAPMQTAQNDCPNKGAVCEPCGTACADRQGGEGGSVTTTIDDHSVDEDRSINIENINVYGSVGSWCPLPPDEEEKGGCAAGCSGKKEFLGEVYFEHGSSHPLGKSAKPVELMEERVKTLNGIVERIGYRLRKQPGDVIVLEAYTSHPGPATYNQNLAEERIEHLALYIGAHFEKSVWKFRQVVHGENHIYRGARETDGQGDPKNRVVRIFACRDPCCDMEQEAVSNP